jgi:superfamily II DNA or RNA helicase
MSSDGSVFETLSADSFLEWAFLRWILHPATRPEIAVRVHPQSELVAGDRHYRLDYEIVGDEHRIVVELDGFEYHGTRNAFSYDRLRQNDLVAAERIVVRFSYDSIRSETGRCIDQLQRVLALDPALRACLEPHPVVEVPEMEPDPLYALAPAPGRAPMSDTYFDEARQRINRRTLRLCQDEAFTALTNYYLGCGMHAAAVMSVGAGKTALGVLCCLAFSRRRALVVTPGSVIRGTFDRAFDHEHPGNVLYGLSSGPLLPGCPPPNVLTLDREEGTIRSITREQLLAADVIITNFHSLGTGEDEDDLLAKLDSADIDFIVVDEAHIAASESYQRLFHHFDASRTLLMSACFQRLDGKPIDADVVYRYRLIDSIADGNAKNLRVSRFEPSPEQTTYEIVWSDGAREEVVGRDAILEMIRDERKLASVVARSTEPIRQVMRAVRNALDLQAELLYPVKPRVLFSALGERHAEQIARIAEEHGIPCDYLHHSMSEARIRRIRERFERDSGDLQGIVQLRMLGQGYDFPPITIVVPMRPYGSFNEFYQFVGRGIRVLTHPALQGRVAPNQQFLDVVFHGELGLEEHIDTIYLENDMDPQTIHALPAAWLAEPPASNGERDLPGTTGRTTAGRPEAFVLFERGSLEERIVHGPERVEQRRSERLQDALAQRYAAYVQTTESPVTFDQFVQIVKQLGD